MAEQNKNNEQQSQNLEAGTYEIIRSRLNHQKEDLIGRIQQLNDERKKVFGAVETALLANDRINTENNCIARDIVAFNKLCIFAYNVHFGLRQEVFLKDVFSIYEFDGARFNQKDLSLITNEQFKTDFQNLYKYYRNTIFSKFTILGNYLHMVFQISENPADIKTFKWLIESDKLIYVDNRSEHEYKFPTQHEFRWQKATRDMFRDGEHAHVSILEKVFVETIGGDLTIKVEDNTSDGLGIYREDVINADQTLDDAEYFFSDLGNLIVLKIKPYQEDFRYFIFNNKMQEVIRVDSLADTGILLPDSQGILLSNGYYLQTGEYKVFDNALHGIKFQERIASPNGEDHLFVFYHEKSSTYLLLMYNVINQSVATPIFCNGYTIFENGELCYFKAEQNATKHHVVQIWQTPYTKADEIASEYKEHILYKIGNKDIVKAMAECQELLVLLNKEDSYEGLYQDIVKNSSDLIDAYYWINDKKTYALSVPVEEIRKTATGAIDEFEKVQRIKIATKEALDVANKNAQELFNKIKYARFESINEYVEALSNLRKLRGESIALKDLRYTDLTWIENLENQIAETSEKLSQNCVNFLMNEKSLLPYKERVVQSEAQIKDIKKVIEGKKLQDELNQIGIDLELLIDIVGNLKIEDTAQSTKIIDDISLIFSSLNQIKASTKNKIKELGGKEATAQFFAQLKLIDQSIISYLDLSNNAAKCDEYLAKLMVQVEELEGKFAEYDEFIEKIGEKREEVYEAFEGKKVQLVETRNKRSISLLSSGERILKSIKAKLKQFKTVEEINAYYAADIMIEKLRETIEQLFEMEDSGKADDLSGQMKAAKEDAVRQLKDKQDLFEDGQTIKLGKYRFTTNQQELDLTILNRDEKLYFHLLGTNFFEAINEPILNENKAFWQQDFVSENREIYRGEYLAFQVLNEVLKNKISNPNFEELCVETAKQKYNEGYTKGVHDLDAAKIASAVFNLNQNAGILAYNSKCRIIALLWWLDLTKETQAKFNQQIKAAGIIKSVFPDSDDFDFLIQNLAQEIENFNVTQQIIDINNEQNYENAAQYLFYEFADNDNWNISKSAVEIYKQFTKFLVSKKQVDLFESSIQKSENICNQFLLAKHWLRSFVQQEKPKTVFLEEEVCFLLLKTLPNKNNIIDFDAQIIVENLNGSHALIQTGNYILNYYNFIEKLENYVQSIVPLYEAFKTTKTEVIENYKSQLRIEEFKPKVLTSFVRNQLIDKVYLPIFGENLAKQIGAAGDNKRTDRQGMLLLISPPGYGKTTLMEYLSNRLGMVFVKINGPALGHHVTNLDPEEAGNAAAKQELIKLNFGLEMGDNVMLYLDDIQHCNPEFLQKFISLSDGQRKIEGVYKGKTKTYDLRGKKICVVMAGNPYTESGDKFRIPDMLSNRADIYNLGDIIGDTEELFKVSMIENALTSNSVLQKLANKSHEDVLSVIKMIENKSDEGITFKASHSKDELQEYKSILEKILRIRDVVLKVNAQYIHSAAMADEYRTEPAFKLQGSYRDMNKMVAKVEAIMNEEELMSIIYTHYQSESQTLTNGAEANMLKFKEMINVQNDVEKERWASIKESFVQNNKLKHLGNDKTAQLVQQLMNLGKNLDGIKDALNGNE